jgi:hypothetical protein
LLGDVLEREPSLQNRANVQKLTEHAAALLKVVRDVFPTYTMHDEQHALNVVALMGRLAGPRIEQMVPLEAALLILAAYFHDIGMVYSAEELAAIPEEEEFEEFLNRDAAAFLAVHEHGQPPADVLERYCRSRHAVRVKVHLDRLDRLDRAVLTWDGMSISTVLQRLCRSHNEPTTDLLLPDFGEFLGAADVRFCAMALRLADIMDFDRTRTPRAIHEYLNLPGTAESERHWQQHLASAGFKFPQTAPPEWPQNYALVYAANPGNPGVEHDIRTSVAEVQAELQRCRAVRDQCPRWRDLPLPGEINTSQIESLGYRYGEFRFELDRSAVLEMFTGEQLYEDPYAFLRELLQNAIDTVETRRRVHGQIMNNPDGVEVTCWEDEEGFLWVRVDDSGMGMDEQHIRNYFLRVGRSYYNSAEFKAELLRSEVADFTPISRFGIGVLSCFMVGDRVEVSTRLLLRGGRYAEMGEALRLSLHRDRDYFVLRSSGQGDDDMPADSRSERGFRRRAGTSVAVRIDPHRTGIELDELVTKADEYLFAPPVPVTVNGRPSGLEQASSLDEPWLEGPVVTTVETAARKSKSAVFPYVAGFRVAALPLNLNLTTHLTGVRGQFMALAAIPPADSALAVGSDLLAGATDSDSYVGGLLSEAVMRTDYHIDETAVTVHRQLRWARIDDALARLPQVTDEQREDGLTESETLDRLLRSPRALARALSRLRFSRGPLNEFAMAYAEFGIESLQEDLDDLVEDIRWAQGGIGLPSPAISRLPNTALIRGFAALSGRLRPDLTISRSGIVAVPFPVHSALQLAVRLAAQRVDAPAEAIAQIGETDLLGVAPAEPYAVATFRADALLTGGAWRSEKVLWCGEQRLSIDEVLARTAAGEDVALSSVASGGWEAAGGLYFAFYQHLSAALLHLHLELEYRPDGDLPGLYAVPPPSKPVRAASDLLPPLFAVPFRAGAELAGAGSFLNAAHPLAEWISTHAERLSSDFAAPFNRVLRRAHLLFDTNGINEALDRVAKARTDIPAPPQEAYVRADKNGWWWSR